ncbi:tRNA (adenosine(37)-N6)-threonylcarbamoyltransferase complex ATPase subunit type 1 TsaE [Candidatus Peregrinibacteria bacterium]|nr:tRNA (adenosine(37)-N6)-threonylcarbamoyltransferase complex ATPase subunit type 1 TsaE [Candidatus Peregrinibacteria bacterium]
MKTIYKTKTPQNTVHLGMQLASRLTPGITVILFGDLGSGKTHFVKGIAKGLGINGIIKSPTFAYVNKYELQKGVHFYHYDLYRLEVGADYESIGLEETMHDSHSINVIEWGDRMAGRHPKDFIRVDFRSLADHHEIAIKFEDSAIVPDELVDKFWKDWATPMHVRAHCKKVTDVCLQIGRAYADRNILINLDILNTAGLLHDMARICDFTELRRDAFHETITEEKWTRWKNLQARFKGVHHADIASDALADEGYEKTAELIRLHNSLSILEEPEPLKQLEAAILFYADKRVKHDETVSLAERFRDGKERHGKFDNLKTRTMFDEVETRTYELEKRLFEPINLQPSDIV